MRIILLVVWVLLFAACGPKEVKTPSYEPDSDLAIIRQHYIKKVPKAERGPEMECFKRNDGKLKCITKDDYERSMKLEGNAAREFRDYLLGPSPEKK